MTIRDYRIFDGQVSWDYVFTFGLSKAPSELRVGERAAFTVNGQATGVRNCCNPFAEFVFTFGQQGETMGLGFYPADSRLPATGAATVHYLLSPQATAPTITLSALVRNCQACVIEWIYERQSLSGPTPIR